MLGLWVGSWGGGGLSLKGKVTALEKIYTYSTICCSLDILCSEVAGAVHDTVFTQELSRDRRLGGSTGSKRWVGYRYE